MVQIEVMATILLLAVMSSLLVFLNRTYKVAQQQMSDQSQQTDQELSVIIDTTSDDNQGLEREREREQVRSWYYRPRRPMLEM